MEVKKRVATLQVNAGLYAEAIANLNDVINAKAGGYYDYYNRGVAFSWLNDYKSAVADYEIAYHMRPDITGSFQDYGTALLELKDYAKAEPVLLKHIEKFPDLAIAHRMLAETYYNQNKNVEALASAKIAVQKNPEDATAQNILAVLLEFSGDNEGALKAYGDAIRLAPDNSKFLFNRATLNRDLENYEAATQDFLKMLELERTVQSLTGLAITYFELQESEKALPLIEEAESIDHKDPLTSYVHGRYFIATGKNDAARDLFQYTLQKDPNFNMAKYWLAVSFYNLGDYETAVKTYAPLESVWPTNSTVRVDQADALYELGKYKEALAKADEVVKLNAKSSLAFATRGRVHAALEKWDLAEADATTSLSLNTDNAQAHYDSAYARWQLQKFPEAQQDYDKAIALAPQRLSIAVERAEFMYFDGKVEQARSVVEKLDAERKSSAALTRMKGRLAEYDGKFPEALKFYETARRENPNMLWVTEDIAYSQIANDQPALALLTCQDMLQKLPKAAASHRCLAKAHMRMSQYDDALAALNKATAMDPKFWAAHLDKAYVQLDQQNYEGAVETLGKLVKEKYRLDTVYYNRGYAYERLKQAPLAVKDYEAALERANPNQAKYISAALNSLRAKQPSLRRMEDAPAPQTTFRR